MLPFLYFQIYIYRIITAFAMLLLFVHVFNGLESARLGYTNFSKLPQTVQDDVNGMARKWYTGFKAAYKKDMSEIDQLGFHINANDCKYHGGVQPQQPWEFHRNQCATPEMLAWCRDEPTWFLFKTTEKDLLVDRRVTLKMSVSCYRVHFFSRYVAEIGMVIPVKLCFMCLVLSLLALRQCNFGANAQQRIDEIMEREAEIEARRAARSPQAPARSPGHPDIKKNLASRHDNYKKKKR